MNALLTALVPPLLALALALPGAAAPRLVVRPLPAPLVVARWWEPPPSPYAAGHRGVDLRAPAGSPVRAPAAGLVRHAGPVAGRGVLSLALAEDLWLTFEPVRPLVRAGARVRAGQVVAVLESSAASHCGPNVACLHWGVLRADRYEDPLPLLPRPVPRLLVSRARRAGPSRPRSR
ncbi:M23 family metallopeptidase [Streptomyces sp. BI20]|uniref:M23 family metallopeptidase n=1 Tax=Streptomyces sp. BI20 TaxID=3403460 RepID=UPI003C72B4B9